MINFFVVGGGGAKKIFPYHFKINLIYLPNLKWNDNTEYVCKKAYSKMWAMRRMKAMGLDSFTLMDFYLKEVRVHLELAVPV